MRNFDNKIRVDDRYLPMSVMRAPRQEAGDVRYHLAQLAAHQRGEDRPREVRLPRQSGRLLVSLVASVIPVATCSHSRGCREPKFQTCCGERRWRHDDGGGGPRGCPALCRNQSWYIDSWLVVPRAVGYACWCSGAERGEVEKWLRNRAVETNEPGDDSASWRQMYTPRRRSAG